ncbi:MAG: SurA N-terminal domain-containing protein [Gallionella sp.]|nr:peptidylprolyl isomerase [Gallionella sp.]
MFDFVHNNKKIVQVIFALMILPFALWGVSSYEKSNVSEGVASVNGSLITQQEFENALQSQEDRMRKQLGANFDSAMLDNPEMKRAVLDNLVNQRLFLDRAREAKLAVTDERIAQVIAGIQAFQNDGKFDKGLYESVLKSQNMTPLVFETRLRDEFIGQQIRDAYIQNGFVSNSVADNVIHLNEQQRVVSVAPIAPTSSLGQVKVEDADIKKYYDQNQKEFETQEQAKVEYVKFSAETLLAKTEVNKEEVGKYYEEHQADFGTTEERHAAHILISVTPTSNQADQEAAKTKAAQLLQQIKQNPVKFGYLAKANSQDPGSATNGGDLGFFARGMMVKPFDDAVFALKVGEVSELVQSDFGYHIIKLIAVKPTRILPLDEAREGIVNKLRQQKALDMFAALAEKFSNSVYEQSDTLKPAAELVGARVEQSDWLTKGAMSGTPWTPKMLEAVFSDDVTKRKRNTSAVEIEPNVFVAARLLEYKPAAVSSLNDVQNAIRQKLVQNKTQELAAKQGKEILASLQGGGKSTLKWGAVQSVTRSKAGSLDAEMLRQVFQANVTKLPQYVGGESPQHDYVIVRIDAVKDGAAVSDENRKGYAQQLRQLAGEEMLHAYLEDAKQQIAVEVNLPDAPKPQP